MRKRFDRRGAFCAQRVRQREEPGERAVHGDVGNGAALRNQRFGLGGRNHIHAVRLQKLRVSGQHGLSLDHGAHAASGQHAKVFRRGDGKDFFLSEAAHNGLAQRMLGKLLRRGGQTIQLRR